MAGNEQIASEGGKNPAGIGYVGMACSKASGVKVARLMVRPVDAKRERTIPILIATELLLRQWRTE